MKFKNKKVLPGDIVDLYPTAVTLLFTTAELKNSNLFFHCFISGLPIVHLDRKDFFSAVVIGTKQKNIFEHICHLMVKSGQIITVFVDDIRNITSMNYGNKEETI